MKCKKFDLGCDGKFKIFAVKMISISVAISVLFSGCLNNEKQEDKQNPDEIITEFFDYLLSNDYYNALNMMISYNGESISEKYNINDIIDIISNSYNETLSSYIQNFNIDINNRITVQDNEIFIIYRYNISYCVRWDGTIRSHYVSIHSMLDSNIIGIHNSDENNILDQMMFIPLYASNGDISIFLEPFRNNYSITNPDVMFIRTLVNQRDYPLLVPGESRSTQYKLWNENGTEFKSPYLDSLKNEGINRIVIGRNERITFDITISYDWHYFEYIYDNETKKSIVNYTKPFDFSIPGTYYFSMNFTYFNHPFNNLSNINESPVFESNIVSFNLIEG